MIKFDLTKVSKNQDATIKFYCEENRKVATQDL
jgi:hypothetical protein